MTDGVLVVDKPAGPTSHDVVARARRALGERRIGHTGTLDPAATGVLALVVGKATRLARFLTSSDKAYEAVVRFGVTTDTYDREGAPTGGSGTAPGAAALEAVLPRFRGTFDQVPPAYSAKKIAGARAYALARGGDAVRPPAVAVTVHALDLVAMDGPLARLSLVCAAGFYVRSLAHDLGEAVGTGACLEALRRVRSGPFGLEGAVPFEALATGDREMLAGRMIPLEALLPDLAAIRLTDDGVRRARHGQRLGPSAVEGGAFGAAPLPPAVPVRLLTPAGRLLGLAEPAGDGEFLHPSLVLS
ncbi:MAG: tRNA pseudouridine(55) synthase TruB [Vicinamibacterales bacterium]